MSIRTVGYAQTGNIVIDNITINQRIHQLNEMIEGITFHEHSTSDENIGKLNYNVEINPDKTRCLLHYNFYPDFDAGSYLQAWDDTIDHIIHIPNDVYTHTFDGWGLDDEYSYVVSSYQAILVFGEFYRRAATADSLIWKLYNESVTEIDSQSTEYNYLPYQTWTYAGAGLTFEVPADQSTTSEEYMFRLYIDSTYVLVRNIYVYLI